MSQITPAEQMPPTPVATRLGQGTAVEMSRAVAEVQAAIVVAQQCPRSLTTARTGMQQSANQLGLAERAFYSYRRAGTTVAGPSVHLARELARCWGNVQYGINELRRDDEYAQSEMQAWAWDVQTNARSSHTFIVPHYRDKQGGPVKLVDLRDIYENNANMGARRLREAIFSILPPWFTAEAEELCQQTLKRGDGRPLEERIEGAVRAFDQLGVPVERLEQKLGRARSQWSGYDIAQLLITHRSIERREISIEDEFPQARVTADEIQAQPQATPPATVAPAPVEAAATTPPPAAAEEPAPAEQKAPATGRGRGATQSQLTAVNTLLGTKLDAKGDARFPVLADLIGRDVESTSELTKDEARHVIDQLSALPDYTPPANDGPGTEPM